MRPVDDHIKNKLDSRLKEIERILDADVMTIVSSIRPGLEVIVRDALEKTDPKKETLAIILETDGGIVEVIERIVETIRHHYKEVIFLIPNRAMSAGTVFVMSGDRIIMDYFSCLGPIDPQFYKDDQLVPALSYLNQFYKLNKKAAKGELTTAESILLNKLDLGELYRFEQACELSIELIEKWLPKYKFKDWNETEIKKDMVDDDMKKRRAKEIAEALNSSDRWHSHGRAINRQTLINELNLKIEEFSEIQNLGPTLRSYVELLADYGIREKLPFFIHTKEYF